MEKIKHKKFLEDKCIIHQKEFDEDKHFSHLMHGQMELRKELCAVFILLHFQGIKLDAWPDGVKERTAYSIYPITFPDGENAEEWKKLFKPCASQRLFLPNILANVDSILYVDTDILFMRPLDDIWAFFGKFNSSQIAALAPESEDAATGWYNRFARHPFYGKLGVNSGVMLMNLTRMRIVNWQDYILPYYKQYKLKITWGDQDLINIFFHYHPEKLYIYPCQWNYRPDHCMYMSVCKLAEMDGVSVLHGSRGVYHNEKQPAFKAVYTAMKQYTFDGDLKSDLVDKANALLMEPTSRGTNCGKVSQLYFKQFQKHLHDRKAQDNSQKKPPS
ncbi:unnamed protein product [Owenia fusiformis]|uniref:UDP-D-xylose:beta-D-glucoside alpha-1,3-D-xylosyltransferase n=1 Tax=Owenia fusiformis TaxID=6347 RepID=A0A8J1XVU9_OWEFU|nr:unnamed protein product [Owenia fusiformis]